MPPPDGTVAAMVQELQIGGTSEQLRKHASSHSRSRRAAPRRAAAVRWHAERSRRVEQVPPGTHPKTIRYRTAVSTQLGAPRTSSRRENRNEPAAVRRV